MNFRELLEAAKNPVNINWKIENENLFGNFIVKNQPFKIEVTKLDNKNVKAYQFKFYRNGEVVMFNDMQYALGVVPTIKKALQECLEKLWPDALVFAASDESTARKSMYKNEAYKLSKAYGYYDISNSKKIKEMGFDNDVIFGVYKNEEVIDKLLEL